MGYATERATDFAQHIKALGFRVFMAERGHYGFFTNADGSRVVSFEFDGLEEKLSGNYGPPSRESGTGWRLELVPRDLKTANDVERALTEYPPPFCGKGWKNFTSLETHLGMYGSSSKYKEL